MAYSTFAAAIKSGEIIAGPSPSGANLMLEVYCKLLCIAVPWSMFEAEIRVIEDEWILCSSESSRKATSFKKTLLWPIRSSCTPAVKFWIDSVCRLRLQSVRSTVKSAFQKTYQLRHWNFHQLKHKINETLFKTCCPNTEGSSNVIINLGFQFHGLLPLLLITQASDAKLNYVTTESTSKVEYR